MLQLPEIPANPGIHFLARNAAKMAHNGQQNKLLGGRSDVGWRVGIKTAENGQNGSVEGAINCGQLHFALSCGKESEAAPTGTGLREFRAVLGSVGNG